MVKTLILLCLETIYVESRRLHAEALGSKGDAGRRKRLRRVKQQPIPRLHRIMSSTMDGKYEPKRLSQDERSFQHALVHCPRVNVELAKLYWGAMAMDRRARLVWRSFLRMDNYSQQHDEIASPLSDILPTFRLNYVMGHDEDYEPTKAERGRTYAWYLDRFGERPAFASATTHGNCQTCGCGLPVWRSCLTCAFAYTVGVSDDIYVRCLECPLEEHQLDLEKVTKCYKCGGPPELSVRNSWNWYDPGE